MKPCPACGWAHWCGGPEREAIIAATFQKTMILFLSIEILGLSLLVLPSKGMITVILMMIQEAIGQMIRSRDPRQFKQRKNGVYLIEDIDTGIFYPPNPNRVWSVRRRGDKGLRGPTIEDLIEERLIIFKRKGDYIKYETLDELLAAIKDGTAHKFARSDLPNLKDWVGKKIGLGSVRIKKFLKDKSGKPNPLSSLLDGIETEYSYSEVVGKTAEGTRQIQEIFGYSVFEYPKPVSLLRLLISQSAGDRDIILDFFAGSGTLGHAVMELNRDDGGDRRFILASSPEATEREPDKNLCRDITAERIRRLNSSLNNSGLSAEFAYLRMRKLSFEDLDHDLSAAELWTALESLHDLPLTPYEGKGWQEHRAEGLILIFADRVDEGLIAHLRHLAQGRENVFVYAWAPGQIREALGDQLDVRSVRDELVRKFRS